MADEPQKEMLKNDVKRLHDYSPKYVFLTETSAILPGFAMKEAWKQAYPGEKLPQFYRVNPTYLQSVMETSRILLGKDKSCYGLRDQGGYSAGLREEAKEIAEKALNSKQDLNKFNLEKRKVENFFNKRIKDKKGLVFVYDEEPNSGRSAGIIVELLSNPEKYGFDSSIKPEKVLMNDVGGAKESFFDPTNNFNYYPFDIKKEQIIDDMPGFFGLISQSKYPNPTYKNKHLKEDIRGKIKTRRVQKESEEYWNKNIVPMGYSKMIKPIKTPYESIKAYKEFGKEVGQELHKELEKKENLEKRVLSVITLSGFALGLFFLGSNFTGNVIGNLSIKTSSWIGIVLFLVGLVGALFWIKKRK